MLLKNMCLGYYREACFQSAWKLAARAVNKSAQNNNTVISRLLCTRVLGPCQRRVTALFAVKNSYAFYKLEHWQRMSTESTELVPIFLQSPKSWDKIAVVSQHGRYTYTDLIHYSADLAKEIQTMCQDLIPKVKQKNAFSLNGERVAFLCENDMSYIVTLLAIWMCGGIAVPLSKSHPVSELEYFIQNSGASLLISTEAYASKLGPIAAQHQLLHKVVHRDDYGGDFGATKNTFLDQVEELVELGPRRWHKEKEKTALIVYTSGTTGQPKGVVHTFGSLHVQITGMVEAWGWKSDDVILHVLPLHHVHGIVNVLLTALYCGATVVMMDKFRAIETWQALLNDQADPKVNVFMAVPTVYAKLLEAHSKLREAGDTQLPDNLKDILQKKIRLMVSGSSALPQTIMKKWEELTGLTLLERYGMTETGMVLTNSLTGNRISGAVGRPFPGVSVRIGDTQEGKKQYETIARGDSNETSVTPGKEGHSGELLVRGDSLFKEYWENPRATLEAFTEDGWFKTGDTAVFEDNTYKIVGRTSVDVIKSGGYKISALEVERHLLEHPDIMDVAVLGLSDETWGQLVAAVIIPRCESGQLDFEQLKAWTMERLPPYQVPRVYRALEAMPRNSMGKVNKKELAKIAFPEYV